jgi:hypothetical protein
MVRKEAEGRLLLEETIDLAILLSTNLTDKVR